MISIKTHFAGQSSFAFVINKGSNKSCHKKCHIGYDVRVVLLLWWMRKRRSRWTARPFRCFCWSAHTIYCPRLTPPTVQISLHLVDENDSCLKFKHCPESGGTFSVLSFRRAVILWPEVRLPDVIAIDRELRPFCMHVVLKFQFDRACFQRGEASANFGVRNSVSNSDTTICLIAWVWLLRVTVFWGCGFFSRLLALLEVS